ncbi:MAG: GNAT family N-acetyltransferase [Bacteroidales bacterium]|jgi:diamine N-acetyltransferase|nr:GNAT family N-acetyltransferase [Bacteroidales bacterium]
MIEGSIVALRAIEPSDVDFFYHLENEPELWQDGFNKHPLSRRAISDFVERCLEGDIYSLHQERLLVVAKESGCVVGCVDAFEVNPFDLTCEIGIVVDKEYRRNGYAADAVRTMINYLCGTIGIHTIDAKVRKTNEASVSLFKSCGFKQCGVLPQHIRMQDSWDDVWIMSYMAK